MPKAKVIAHELEGPSISMVSLVKRGANRTPFQIVKDENGNPVTPETLMGKLSNILKGPQGAANVLAVVVRKGAEEKYKDHILALGFEKAVRKEDKNQVTYIAEGADLDIDGSFVALNEDIAIATDRVFKMFESFPMSTDFEENMRGSTFFPGVNWATEALMDTFWSTMMDARTPTEARSTIEAALDAFSAHILEMVSALPQAVFKMEYASLSDESSAGVSKTDHEGGDMKTNLKEAVAGDLDGLDADTGSARGTAVSKEEVANAAAASKETEVKQDDTEQETQAASGDDKPVEKEGEAKDDAAAAEEDTATASTDGTEDDLKALVTKMAGGLTAIVTTLGTLEERLAKMETDLKETQSVAKSAQESSGRVVNLQSAGADLDMALSSLGGSGKVAKSGGNTVQKSEKDVWEGTMTALDGLGRSR